MAAIAMGSNLGDRRAHLDAACAALRALPRTAVRAVSAYVETEPVGPPGQGLYLNAAALLDTALAPRPLLLALLEIERSRGRRREDAPRWGPRTLDLDLLLYADLVLDEPGLTVPHPRMHERRFVLGPLAELAPDIVVPLHGVSVRAMLERIEREPQR